LLPAPVLELELEPVQLQVLEQQAATLLQARELQPQAVQ
jgi:hypothetical protein